MANKKAAYKNSLVLGELAEWWEFETNGPRKKPYTDLVEMFINYTQYTLYNENYELILNIYDFERCLFKEGIRKLGDLPQSPYVRAETWRPSDEQVMRLEVHER